MHKSFNAVKMFALNSLVALTYTATHACNIAASIIENLVVAA